MYRLWARAARWGRRGITLIELIAAAVILGVLAVIVVPNLTGASHLAKHTAFATTLAATQSGSDQFFGIAGAYPTYAGATVTNQPGSCPDAFTLQPGALDPQGAAFVTGYLRTAPSASPAVDGLDLSNGTVVYYGVASGGAVFATQVPPQQNGNEWTLAGTPVYTQDYASPADPTTLGFLCQGIAPIYSGVSSSATVTGSTVTVSGTAPPNDTLTISVMDPQTQTVTASSSGSYSATFNNAWTAGTPTIITVTDGTGHFAQVVIEANGTILNSTGTTGTATTMPPLAVGTNTGVFLWNGSAWTALGNPSGGTGNCASYTPLAWTNTTTLVAANYCAHVFAWSGSWQNITGNLGFNPNGPQINAFALDGAGALAAAPWGNGLWAWQGGGSWSQVVSNTTDWLSLADDPAQPATLAGGLYLSSTDTPVGIITSTSTSTSWGWTTIGDPSTNNAGVGSTAWSPQGQLAAGTYDNGVALWEGGGVWNNIGAPGSSSAVNTLVAWSPSSTLAAAVVSSGVVGLWTGSQWKSLGVPNGATHIYAIAWSGDGQLAVGTNAGVSVWNGTSWTNLGDPGGTPYAFSVAWQP